MVVVEVKTQRKTVNVPSDAFFMPEFYFFVGRAADILKKPT